MQFTGDSSLLWQDSDCDTSASIRRDMVDESAVIQLGTLTSVAIDGQWWPSPGGEPLIICPGRPDRGVGG